MLLRHFIMHHGKHEDQSWATLIFTHDKGFEHPRDAMGSFRKALLACVGGRTPSACCKGMAEDFNFCPKCGTPRAGVWDADEEAANLFHEMFGMTLDGTHELHETLEEHGWKLGGLASLEHTCMVVNVDRWLDDPYCYMEAHLPDRTRWTNFEDILGSDDGEE